MSPYIVITARPDKLDTGALSDVRVNRESKKTVPQPEIYRHGDRHVFSRLVDMIRTLFSTASPNFVLSSSTIKLMSWPVAVVEILFYRWIVIGLTSSSTHKLYKPNNTLN